MRMPFDASSVAKGFDGAEVGASARTSADTSSRLCRSASRVMKRFAETKNVPDFPAAMVLPEPHVPRLAAAAPPAPPKGPARLHFGAQPGGDRPAGQAQSASAAQSERSPWSGASMAADANPAAASVFMMASAFVLSPVKPCWNTTSGTATGDCAVPVAVFG